MLRVVPNPIRATLTKCELCGGHGTLVRSSPSLPPISGPPPASITCWLCGGQGMVTRLRSQSWVQAGRPKDKPSNWTA
jgi:hypothetical protein